MPSKLDKVPINNPLLDRRVKLSEQDKLSIVKEYESGLISITRLAKKYGVSKRLIQFTLFPERKEKARANYLENRKDGRYYDKEKHRKTTQTHREYKKKLHEEGLLQVPKNQEGDI